MTESEKAAFAAAQRIVDLFSAHNVAAYFQCFAENASFVFYNHSEVLTCRKAYEDLWQQWEKQHGFKVLNCQSHAPHITLFNDVAVFTHKVTTQLLWDGETCLNHEKESIILLRQENRWICIHEHLSPQT